MNFHMGTNCESTQYLTTNTIKKYDTLPWIEKYRPNKLSNVISHTDVIAILKKYISKNTMPNIILFGLPGTGKTSIIKSCANELYGEHVRSMTLEINASEERGVDIIRTRVYQFANGSPTFIWDNIATPKVKLVILDEADSMTVDAQMALKNIMDMHSQTTRFCMMCNSVNKIHPSLTSRCMRFRIHSLPEKQMISYIGTICESEKINITKHAISNIAKYSGGDMRRTINILQSISTAYNHSYIDKKIDDVCVDTYLNKIPMNIFGETLKNILDASVKTSYHKINDLFLANGFSIGELIRSLSFVFTGALVGKNKSHMRCMTLNIKKLSRDVVDLLDNIPAEKLQHIIMHLGNLERCVFSNVPTSVILASLVSIKHHV